VEQEGIRGRGRGSRLGRSSIEAENAIRKKQEGGREKAQQ
jgi:hypothetical protein